MKAIFVKPATLKVSYWIGILVLLVSTSCSTDDKSNNGPDILYNISGSVLLFTEDGQFKDSYAGMKVKITDSDPILMVETDEEGNFTFEEVPKGTYSLSFEKDGYGTYKVFEVDHTGDENTFFTSSPSLSEKSTTSVSDVEAELEDESIVIETTLVQDANNSEPRFLRFFFSTSSDLSATKYEAYTDVYKVQINPSAHTFTRDILIKMGFETGETVYVKVVGESVFGNDYEDPDKEMRIFPNILWTDEGDSFIVP